MDNEVLCLRLKSTRYKDENGRMQMVTPDDDYFLVWQKAGSALPRASAFVQEDLYEEEDDEEDSKPARAPLYVPVTIVFV